MINPVACRRLYDAVGPQNIPPIKGLIRALSNCENFNGSFRFSTQDIERLLKLNQTARNTEQVEQFMALLRKSMPQSFSKDSQHIADVAFNRQGENLSLEVLGKTVNKKGAPVSNANVTWMATPSEIRIGAANSAEASNFNMDIVVPRDPAFDINSLGRKALENTKITEANGMTTVTLPRTTENGFTAELNYTAPTDVVNAYAQSLSRGKCSTPGEMLKMFG